LVQEKYDLTRRGLDGRPDPNYYAPELIEAGEFSPWLRSSVSYSLTYNSIDDMKNPRDGLFGRFTQEFAGLGGDAKYMKTTFKGTYYQTLMQEADIVGMLGVGAGYIHEFDSNGVRIFDLFKNNSDMIRGFKFNGIGPYQDAENGGNRYWLGGTTYFNGSAEVQFPM